MEPGDGRGKVYAFPTPEALARAPLKRLQACGLSERKAEYVRDISISIHRGAFRPEELKLSGNTDEIIAELMQIRGVGRWTAELTAIRGLNRLDVLPADDLGVRRAIAYYYRGGRRTSPDEARYIAAGWAPWRGLAAHYLITAQRLAIPPGGEPSPPSLAPGSQRSVNTDI
jgi:DNA-3-methyladenine glycosylase II